MTDYKTKKLEAVIAVKQFEIGEHLPFLLNELKNDIALSIIQTDFDKCEKREELYMLTKAIDAINVKLQECVNEYDKIQESK